MTGQQVKTADPTNKNWVIFLLLSAYLIFTFLWRSLTKAHESPLRTEQLMTIGLDAVAVIGLIFMRTQLSKGKFIFWVALAAGLGLFAIRFSSDEGWWSGHLYMNLCPRQGEAIVCRCRDDYVSWLCP